MTNTIDIEPDPLSLRRLLGLMCLSIALILTISTFTNKRIELKKPELAISLRSLETKVEASSIEEVIPALAPEKPQEQFKCATMSTWNAQNKDAQSLGTQSPQNVGLKVSPPTLIVDSVAKNIMTKTSITRGTQAGVVKPDGSTSTATSRYSLVETPSQSTELRWKESSAVSSSQESLSTTRTASDTTTDTTTSSCGSVESDTAKEPQTLPAPTVDLPTKSTQLPQDKPKPKPVAQPQPTPKKAHPKPVGDAKAFIYHKESGNNPHAINKRSGACGLGQALPCSKMPCELADYACQDAFFTQYMEDRYGTWEKARAFWQCTGKCYNKYGSTIKRGTWW